MGSPLFSLSFYWRRSSTPDEIVWVCKFPPARIRWQHAAFPYLEQRHQSGRSWSFLLVDFLQVSHHLQEGNFYSSHGFLELHSRDFSHQLTHGNFSYLVSTGPTLCRENFLSHWAAEKWMQKHFSFLRNGLSFSSFTHWVPASLSFSSLSVHSNK